MARKIQSNRTRVPRWLPPDFTFSLPLSLSLVVQFEETKNLLLVHLPGALQISNTSPDKTKNLLRHKLQTPCLNLVLIFPFR